jgi:hypothetical protein
MLILKNFYLQKDYNHKHTSKYVLFDYTDSYNSPLIVDIWDTDKNEYYVRKCNVCDFIIKSRLKEIFGVFQKNSMVVVFYKITDSLWKFMDICDGITPVFKNNLPMTVDSLPKKEVQYFNVGNYRYCVVYMDFIVSMNKNHIFLWDTEIDIYMDVLDLYMSVLHILQGKLTNFDEIYISINKSYYKLSLNKSILIFLTKQEILSIIE